MLRTAGELKGAYKARADTLSSVASHNSAPMRAPETVCRLPDASALCARRAVSASMSNRSLEL